MPATGPSAAFLIRCPLLTYDAPGSRFLEPGAQDVGWSGGALDGRIVDGWSLFAQLSRLF
jgi:hypothetical protein